MTHVPQHARNGAPRLSEDELRALLAQFPDWRRDGDSIERKVEVRDFRAALRLVNLVGEAAERENHHPDLAMAAESEFVVDHMKSAFPELDDARGTIERVVTTEERLFSSTLSNGLRKLDEFVSLTRKLAPRT